jgi:hypothetical protein
MSETVHDPRLQRLQLRSDGGLQLAGGVILYDKDGVPTLSAGLDVWKYVTTASVHATAATFADITGLTQALLSGRRYAFEAALFHKADAATTGAQFGYNIDAAPTAALFGVQSVNTNSATAAALSSGVTPTRDTAATVQTLSSTTDVLTIVKGYIQPSANGTFALRATSEVTVAAGLTIGVGSWLHIRELAAS